MGDVKIFRLTNGQAEEVKAEPAKLEKKLQQHVEQNLETLLDVKLVASEHSTGKKHGGRIDTLGLDDNSCPVIIEYKRKSNPNVINQGLFYLDWLMDHKAEFQLLVQKQLGEKVAEDIDWSAPRLLCMAENYNRYDIHAIQQINRNIELLRYMYFGSDLIMIEMVNVNTASTGQNSKPIADNNKGLNEIGSKAPKLEKTIADHLANASPNLLALYEEIHDFMINELDNVRAYPLHHYIAYRRIRNLAALILLKQKDQIKMWLSIDPDSVELEDGFSRDVQHIGHHGTGKLELMIKNFEDIEKTKHLIKRSIAEH